MADTQLESVTTPGRYPRQIANFLTFESEDAAFPFNDWPTAD